MVACEPTSPDFDLFVACTNSALETGGTAFGTGRQAACCRVLAVAYHIEEVREEREHFTGRLNSGQLLPPAKDQREHSEEGSANSAPAFAIASQHA